MREVEWTGRREILPRFGYKKKRKELTWKT
jgi:hypothetical protein